MTRSAILLAAAAILAGCGERDGAPPAPAPAEDRSDAAPAPPSPLPSAENPAPAEPRPELIGEAVVRAEWARARYRGACAPLALRSDGGAGGVPRPADFSGGWAVAFDQPGRRSAYGVAGTGPVPDDQLDFATHVDRLTKQWPFTRRWGKSDGLPAGSFAGYGLEGGRDYPTGSSGFGRQSLAYLRIPGQACLYNIWSKLGRDHLELLLDQLVMLER